VFLVLAAKHLRTIETAVSVRTFPGIAVNVN
jgi:hypothetical protein